MTTAVTAGKPSLQVVDHLLCGARQRPSPNADARPDAGDIRLVVVHGISLPAGVFGTGQVEKFFMNRLDCRSHPSFASIGGVRVSTHLFIDRRGIVIQFVPFHRRAWHAGVSSWRGRSGCNDFSIGIELEGLDEIPYTLQQYDTLAAVIASLLAAYPLLAPGSVVGHCHVAPGRKRDPGDAFDWPRLRKLLTQPDLSERHPYPGGRR